MVHILCLNASVCPDVLVYASHEEKVDLSTEEFFFLYMSVCVCVFACIIYLCDTV